MKTAPCNHTALDNGKHTQCCEPGDLCLTNGLCREETVNDITNYAWRFGCTDPKFEDATCGTDYCDAKLAGSGEHILNQPVCYTRLTSPGIDNKLTWKCPENGTWCCNTGDSGPYENRVNRTNTTCCSIPDLLFTALNPEIFATASIYGSMFPVPTLISSTALRNATATTSATTNPSAVNALNSASVTPAPSPGYSALKIGLGAGLGSFAAITLGLGSFLVWRRRKRNSELPRSATPAKELSDQDVAEASSRNRAELTGMDYRRELTSPVSPVELWSPTSPVERSELSTEQKGRLIVGEVDGRPIDRA